MNETASPAGGAMVQEPAVIALSRPQSAHARRGSRGWLVRRLLLAADLVGASAAVGFATVAADASAGALDASTAARALAVTGFLLVTWPLLAKLEGLYDHDEARAGHSTSDEVAGVVHVVTLSALAAYCFSVLGDLHWSRPSNLLFFWLLAVVFVTAGRGLARTGAARSASFAQRTLIVGAGDVGQLLARKIAHHPEYGIELVGFVDGSPRLAQADLPATVLGGLDELVAVAERLSVARVVVAFSLEPNEHLLEAVRTLRTRGVRIDIVPRLFDLVGPNVVLHSLEGLPLLGLPDARISRSSALLKRLVDLVGASIALVLLAPLFLAIAVRIRLDSRGPVFFRQTRLGANMREFTILKFRTMHVGTDEEEHRSYIRAAMDGRTAPSENGIYKLSRPEAVTRVGRWLRRTSLDELPQLLNVIRGEMSLVGPRPCIPYETENFAAHHFERFLVPAGMTGLWQVTARGHATYGEALDMDVAYARGWSLDLDLTLILRTVGSLLRPGARKATA